MKKAIWKNNAKAPKLIFYNVEQTSNKFACFTKTPQEHMEREHLEAIMATAIRVFFFISGLVNNYLSFITMKHSRFSIHYLLFPALAELMSKHKQRTVPV